MKLATRGAREHRLFAALACAVTAACGGGQVSPSDVIESDDGRSFADTLLFLVTVKDQSTTPERYLDSDHVHRIELDVDGRSWGTFTVTPEKDTPGDYRYHDSPDEKLVVATLSERDDREELELETAEDWVDFLGEHLSPGGHVAELRRLWLRAGEDLTEIPVGEMVPFELGDGYESALVGSVEVATRALGAP